MPLIYLGGMVFVWRQPLIGNSTSSLNRASIWLQRTTTYAPSKESLLMEDVFSEDLWLCYGLLQFCPESFPLCSPLFQTLSKNGSCPDPYHVALLDRKGHGMWRKANTAFYVDPVFYIKAKTFAYVQIASVKQHLHEGIFPGPKPPGKIQYRCWVHWPRSARTCVPPVTWHWPAFSHYWSCASNEHLCLSFFYIAEGLLLASVCFTDKEKERVCTRVRGIKRNARARKDAYLMLIELMVVCEVALRMEAPFACFTSENVGSSLAW